MGEQWATGKADVDGAPRKVFEEGARRDAPPGSVNLAEFRNLMETLQPGTVIQGVCETKEGSE